MDWIIVLSLLLGLFFGFFSNFIIIYVYNSLKTGFVAIPTNLGIIYAKRNENSLFFYAILTGGILLGALFLFAFPVFYTFQNSLFDIHHLTFWLTVLISSFLLFFFTKKNVDQNKPLFGKFSSFLSIIIISPFLLLLFFLVLYIILSGFLFFSFLIFIFSLFTLTNIFSFFNIDSSVSGTVVLIISAIFSLIGGIIVSIFLGKLLFSLFNKYKLRTEAKLKYQNRIIKQLKK